MSSTIDASRPRPSPPTVDPAVAKRSRQVGGLLGLGGGLLVADGFKNGDANPTWRKVLFATAGVLIGLRFGPDVLGPFMANFMAGAGKPENSGSTKEPAPEPLDVDASAQGQPADALQKPAPSSPGPAVDDEVSKPIVDDPLPQTTVESIQGQLANLQFKDLSPQSLEGKPPGGSHRYENGDLVVVRFGDTSETAVGVVSAALGSQLIVQVPLPDGGQRTVVVGDPEIAELNPFKIGDRATRRDGWVFEFGVSPGGDEMAVQWYPPKVGTPVQGGFAAVQGAATAWSEHFVGGPSASPLGTVSPAGGDVRAPQREPVESGDWLLAPRQGAASARAVGSTDVIGGFELQFASATDPGRIRHNQEDRVLVRPDLGIFAVADGMGGGTAGEVAAEIAVSKLAEVVSSSPEDRHPMATLDEGFATAQNHIRDERQWLGVSDKDSMGTTLSALYFKDGQALLQYVGDTRGYRLRGGELVQMTPDHTWVARWVAEGRITPEEAKTHPQRNVLTKALDGKGEVKPDVGQVDAQEGDVFLICSDGLYGAVPHADIERVLRDYSDLNAASEELIRLANAHGGPDNISCVLVRVKAKDNDPLIPDFLR